jgi:hypothetical protein
MKTVKFHLLVVVSSIAVMLGPAIYTESTREEKEITIYSKTKKTVFDGNSIYKEFTVSTRDGQEYEVSSSFLGGYSDPEKVWLEMKLGETWVVSVVAPPTIFSEQKKVISRIKKR